MDGASETQPSTTDLTKSNYTYDVSPDGQRFVMREVRPGTGPVISIVTNWRPQP